MGRVMVDSFLSAHQGQMPDAAWQKRVDEWTPDVSARGWAGAIAEQGCGEPTRGVVLVAEDNAGVLCALVSGAAASDDPSRSTAEIGALYVLPDRRGQGIGGCLLRAAASKLATLGFLTSRPGGSTKRWVDMRSANGHSTKQAFSFP